jgi:hypothetical protein
MRREVPHFVSQTEGTEGCGQRTYRGERRKIFPTANSHHPGGVPKKKADGYDVRGHVRSHADHLSNPRDPHFQLKAVQRELRGHYNRVLSTDNTE